MNKIVQLTPSSCNGIQNSQYNILTDDDKEWVSRSDHENMWLYVDFKELLTIDSILIADRVSPDNSLCKVNVIFFNKGKEDENNLLVPVNGNGDITEFKLPEQVTATSAKVSATKHVWGRDVGLRFLDFISAKQIQKGK